MNSNNHGQNSYGEKIARFPPFLTLSLLFGVKVISEPPPVLSVLYVLVLPHIMILFLSYS